MGGAISKQINFVPQMHKEVGMEEHYTAIPLKDISSEIYKELKNVPFFYDTINMSNFLEKICVAKVALFRPSGAPCESYMAELNLDEEIFKTNLKSLKQMLLDIASLPKTGQPLLEELNTLLDNCYKLVISFSGASKTSPMEKQISFSIQSKDNENVAWTSIAINLPERYEDFYNLNFFCIQDKTVIEIQEPTFLIIIHELIHGIQDLQADKMTLNTERHIIEEFQKQYSSEELLTNTKFHKFWGDINSWPMEFQAMVTGITCLNGERVSESLAIQEFLNSNLFDKSSFAHLQSYKGKILIPFGHSEKVEPTEENINFMLKSYEMLPRLDYTTTSNTINADQLFHTPTFDTMKTATIENEVTEMKQSKNNL